MIRPLAWWKTNRSTSSSATPASSQAPARGVLERGDGGVEGRVPVHAQDRVVAAGDDRVGERGVRAEHERPDRSLAALEGAEHDGARAVAEQRGGALVVVVGEAREHVCADDQHGLRAAALDERGADAERRDPGGAGRADVHRGGVRGAEGGGHVGRGVGRDLVGGGGADQDDVELRGVDAGVGDRVAAGLDREVREALVGRGVAARADAGALDDPGVVDPQPLGDREVGDDGLGQEVAETEDRRGALLGGVGDVLEGGGGARHGWALLS